jgi:hypothetical protein
MKRPLREILMTKQTPGEPCLRWWQNDYFDLFVWFEPEEIRGFQLCYDRGHDEHALTWRREFGTVSHHSVDDGQRGTSHARSPILRAAKGTIPAGIAERFEGDAGVLPEECRSLIQQVLTTFCEAKTF